MFTQDNPPDMQSSGHRFRDVEHHPLLNESDGYSPAPPDGDLADRLWFIRDGCGMVCAVITWMLVLYADFVVTFVMLLPSKDFWFSVINGTLFNCLAVMALASHMRTMLTDPVSARTPAAPPPSHSFNTHCMSVSKLSYLYNMVMQSAGAQ